MANFVRMITKAEHQYAGRRLHPGDEYDCEEIHVAVFRRLGWSDPVMNGSNVEEPQRVKRQYRRRDLQAQP